MRPDYSVLLVDDDAWFRMLVRGLLMRHPSGGWRRRTYGRDEVVEEGPVDLLMTDLMMPGPSGLATIHAARSAFPVMKILAVSGVRDKERSLRAAEMTVADAALQKPITRAGLLQTLEALLGS